MTWFCIWSPLRDLCGSCFLERLVMRFLHEREYQEHIVFVGARYKHTDTRQVLRPLYNCPSGIQAPKLETRIQLEFPIRDTLPFFDEFGQGVNVCLCAETSC